MELNVEELKKISEENVYIDYKELCNRCNMKYSYGNSKISQLKELATFCDYEKDKAKFLIKEVYDEQKQLIDSRMVTLPKIELILMTELSQIKGSLFATNKELLKLCYIINNNYYNVLSNKDKNSTILAEKYNFDDSFFEYVDKTYDILKPNIVSALNSMKKKKEIDITTGYRIKRKDGSILCVTSAPTDEIGKRIFEIQGDILAEMGMKSLRDCYKKGEYSVAKLKEYYENCNIRLRQECYCNQQWIENGWNDFTNFYQCYAITLNQNKIKYDLERELKVKSDLNNVIKDKLHNTKRLRDLSYNEIDKWFIVFNTKEGDYEYDFAEDIREYYKNIDKK